MSIILKFINTVMVFNFTTVINVLTIDTSSKCIGSTSRYLLTLLACKGWCLLTLEYSGVPYYNKKSKFIELCS